MEPRGRIHTDRSSFEAPQLHPVEVFCVGSHIAGKLRSARPRLSDHLEADEQVIEITDASLKSAHSAIPFVENNSVFINKAKVLFVLDLTPAEQLGGSPDMKHPTDAHDILVSVGDFWISGNLRLPMQGDLQHFLAYSPRRFVPITRAAIIGTDGRPAGTILVNREHLEAIVARPVG